MSCPPTCCFSFSQLAALGQDGSEGRTRGKRFDGRALFGWVGKPDHKPGNKGSIARRFSNVRLSIEAHIDISR